VQHHVATLELNLITLVVTIAATRRRPILSYKLLVALAFLAVGCDLWALLSRHDSVWVLCTTTALFVAMLVRISWDRHGARNKKRQRADTTQRFFGGRFVMP
jgi:hypothetical protein